MFSFLPEVDAKCSPCHICADKQATPLLNLSQVQVRCNGSLPGHQRYPPPPPGLQACVHASSGPWLAAPSCSILSAPPPPARDPFQALQLPCSPALIYSCSPCKNHGRPGSAGGGEREESGMGLGVPPCHFYSGAYHGGREDSPRPAILPGLPRQVRCRYSPCLDSILKGVSAISTTPGPGRRQGPIKPWGYI